MWLLMLTALLGAVSAFLAALPYGWMAALIALPCGGSGGALLFAVLTTLFPGRSNAEPAKSPYDAQGPGNPDR